MVVVSSSPSGRLTQEQLSTSLQLLEHLKQRPENTVVVISGHEWCNRQEHNTFSEAYDIIEQATEPTYTENIHTATLGGSRFYRQEGDMMELLVDVFATSSGSAFEATEDILIGSPDSYSSPHLDNAPCNPNRVTVLMGKKKVAAWPFHPDVTLPNDMPISHVDPDMPSPPMTPEVWQRIEQYAVQHGGWVQELGPCTVRVSQQL